MRGSQRSMAPSAKADMFYTWHIRCSTSSERNGRKSERGQNARSKISFKSGNHFLQRRVRFVGLFVRHEFDGGVNGVSIADRHSQWDGFRSSQCFRYRFWIDN